jgi:hypothetical protein
MSEMQYTYSCAAQAFVVCLLQICLVLSHLHWTSITRQQSRAWYQLQVVTLSYQLYERASCTAETSNVDSTALRMIENQQVLTQKVRSLVMQQRV